jgi:cold shock CspA family protein
MHRHSTPRSFDRPTGPTEEVDGSKHVFVHRSLLAREGIDDLAEGQRIRKKVVPGAKGREAIGVSLKHDG